MSLNKVYLYSGPNLDVLRPRRTKDWRTSIPNKVEKKTVELFNFNLNILMCSKYCKQVYSFSILKAYINIIGNIRKNVFIFPVFTSQNLTFGSAGLRAVAPVALRLRLFLYRMITNRNIICKFQISIQYTRPLRFIQVRHYLPVKRALKVY